jgi:hypothetical protein
MWWLWPVAGVVLAGRRVQQQQAVAVAVDRLLAKQL